jgi:hypothetical protein
MCKTTLKRLGQSLSANLNMKSGNNAAVKINLRLKTLK